MALTPRGSAGPRVPRTPATEEVDTRSWARPGWGPGRRSLRPKILQSYDEVYEYVCAIIGEGAERGYAERGDTNDGDMEAGDAGGAERPRTRRAGERGRSMRGRRTRGRGVRGH